MKIIKLLVFVFALLLVSCQSKKEKYELTFFRWSIHEDYYLKINSSDTVYFVIDNPIEKQTKYTILEKDEKQKLENFISRLSFPKDEQFSRDVNDGLSFVFFYKDKLKKNRLLIHAHVGPKEFWEFGNYLETIKNNSTFIPVNKKINLKDIQDFMFIKFSPPPTITATNKAYKKTRQIFEKLGVKTFVLKPKEFIDFYHRFLNISSNNSLTLPIEIIKRSEYEQVETEDAIWRYYFFPYYLFDFFNKILVIVPNDENEKPIISLSRNSSDQNNIYGMEIKLIVSKINGLLGEDIEKIGEVDYEEFKHEKWIGRKWKFGTVTLRLERNNGHVQLYYDI